MANEITITDPKVLKKLKDPRGRKFRKWCELFLNPESETHGNATKSALKSYNVKKYFTAGAIGHQNYKKLQTIGMTIDELEGRGPKVWMQIASKKAMEGSLEDVLTWMREIGYLEKLNTGVGNQINQQFNFGDLADAFTKARQERGLPVDGVIDK